MMTFKNYYSNINFVVLNYVPYLWVVLSNKIEQSYNEVILTSDFRLCNVWATPEDEAMASKQV